MPLTPLHLGPGILVALLLLGILDLPTLLVAIVIYLLRWAFTQ